MPETEVAGASVRYAAYAIDAGRPDRALAAASAKAAAADAAREVTAAAIQLHGALGFTWEADPHLLYRRALLDAELLGGAAAQWGRVTALQRVVRDEGTA